MKIKEKENEIKTEFFIHNSDNYLITSKLTLITQNLSSIL